MTHMISRFSTAKVVVVHRWKIVVNKTHGVDHLQRHGSRHRLFLGSSKHLTSSQAKDWTDTLAACHERIQHGLADLLCLRLGRDDRSLKGSLNWSFLGKKVLIQVKFRCGTNRQTARDCGSWSRRERRSTRCCQKREQETETELHAV